MEAAAYGAMYGLAALVAAIYWVFIIGVAAVQIIAEWKILVKTGEPGWKCLIPFVNGHTLYKKFWKPVYYWLTIAMSVVVTALAVVEAVAFEPTYHYGGAPVWFAGLLVVLYMAYAILTIVWSVKLYLGMARSFGYGGGFAAGLFFLPLIFQLLLAFNKDAYLGNTYVKQAAPEAKEEL